MRLAPTRICRLTFTSSVLPANATTKTLKWTSSNTKVATIDQNGKVTAVAEGETTITATATDGSGKKDTASIRVNFNVPKNVSATGIKLNKTSIELDGSSSTQLTAILTPSNTTDNVAWRTSNSEIAQVIDGEVYACNPGTATITAYVVQNPNLKATCTVTVDYITSVEINDSSVQLTAKGATYQLSAKITPANTKHNALSWSSSDTSVATVDQNGKVTAVGNGYATITCKAADTKQPYNPDLTSTCSVTVKIPEATPTPTPSQPSNIVETVNLAGGETYSSYLAMEDVNASVNLQNVEMVLQGNTDVISISGKGYDSRTGCAYTDFRALKTGQVIIIAKYNGQTLKRWNVNVTSNWSEYMSYVAWRKDVESQIWNSNMSVVQKLDAAKDYIKSEFTYDNSNASAAVYAYKTKRIECTTASELFGDFAKDLNVRVGYVNSNTGKIYDYLVEAIGGHVFNAVLLNDNWVYYDAQP